MQIYEIKDKKIWDDFVTAQSEHSFLHAFAWGEFNRSMDDKVWRLGVYDLAPTTAAPIASKDKLIAVALVIKVHARRGNFLFIPHGPVFDSNEKNSKFDILKLLTQEFKKVAKEEKVNFIRVSPILLDTEENIKIFKKLGYREAPIYMHAENTWVLPLDSDEENLLYGMRKNTRNLIRRAKKEEVSIISGNEYYLIDNFIKLYKETAKKHSFVPFSERYIDSEIKAFNQEENCEAKVYLAKYKGEYIAGAVVVFYGDSAFYHHGASSSKYSKIPASYLLQWQAIKDAKGAGKNFYNFWGIVKNENDKKNPWYGLTLFKKGFGGMRRDHMHAQDLPITPFYWLNYVVEKVRLWKRGV